MEHGAAAGWPYQCGLSVIGRGSDRFITTGTLL
jgi:hypothetical protein